MFEKRYLRNTQIFVYLKVNTPSDIKGDGRFFYVVNFWFCYCLLKCTLFHEKLKEYNFDPFEWLCNP